METRPFPQSAHSHTFGQDQKKDGENRSLVVIAITLAMMLIEIAAGMRYGSMALLADGLHMGSHACALAITAFAYIYARKRASDPRFSFGTGKVNSLAGYTGALLLAGFALMMAWESVERLIRPQDIAYNSAILVAIIGLVVNGGCVFILNPGKSSKSHHDHDHDHDHHDCCHEHEHGHDHHHGHHHFDGSHHHDHNLRSAYLHVLADALTSLTAIFALLAAKYFGFNWMDPVMGILGSVLVASWSLGLLKSSSKVLLDHQAPEATLLQVRHAIEAPGDCSVSDLHIWSIGPGIYSSMITIATDRPQPTAVYKARIPHAAGIAHLSLEVAPTH